jgi:hypothetical protein
MRRAVGVLCSLATAAGLVMAVPGVAQAGGYGCSGSLVKTYAVKSKWHTISHVKIYYNANSGWNCAVNVKTKYFQQFKHETSIWLYNQTLTEDNVRNGVNTDSDNGKFWKLAGPVRVKGKNMCISFVADSYYYDEHAHLSKSGILCG